MKQLSINLIACLILFLPAVSIGQSTIVDACDWENVKKDAKKDLKPYQYYAFKITKITFSDAAFEKEVEVPLFMDADYRFVFNTMGLPQEIKVQIYNKPKGNPDRKMIYETTSANNQFTFDPQKGDAKNRIYINYVVPASKSGNADKGCVLFYSGSKF
jgi:hypothetical protein